MSYTPYYNDYTNNPSPDAAERLQVGETCASWEMRMMNLATTTDQKPTSNCVCSYSNEVL